MQQPTPAPSPFLADGRQFAWDSTSLGYAKECKRKYYYIMIEGWRPKSHSADLTFGLHYAKALETYHGMRADGADHEEALRAVVLETLHATWHDGQPWVSGHNFKNRDTLIRSIIWYLEAYKDDPCQTIILDNGKAAVELSFQFNAGDDIVLCGHLDRLVSYAGSIYVQDQKTTGSTLGSYYFKRYTPDNQMSLYSVAAEVVFSTPVQGVMLDVAQIAVGFTRFERGFAHRSDEQKLEWLGDMAYHVYQTWNAAEYGWPMNDKACQLYGGCPFLEVCSKSPQVRQAYLETGFEKRRWNPLEVR